MFADGDVVAESSFSFFISHHAHSYLWFDFLNVFLTSMETLAKTA